MRSRAGEGLVESMKALLVSDDNKGDFKIKSKDGKEFRVHSILLLERGHFLRTVVSSNFKEKNEQKLELPFSSSAVQILVNFLYGEDIKEDIDLMTLTSLIEIGQTYDFKHLFEAALELLQSQLGSKSQDEVYEVLVHFKNIECDRGIEICKHFLERPTWSSLSWTKYTSRSSWDPVSEDVKWPSFDMDVNEDITLHAIRICQSFGAEIEFEIVKSYKDRFTGVVSQNYVHTWLYPEGSILEVEEDVFYEHLEPYVLQEDVTVVFKEPCMLTKGDRLEISMRGKGAIMLFDHTEPDPENPSLPKVIKNGCKLNVTTSPVVAYKGKHGFIKALYF